MALTQANEQSRLFSGGGHVVLLAVIELPGNQKCAAGTAVSLAFHSEQVRRLLWQSAPVF